MAVNELVKELLQQLERLSNTGAVTGKVRQAGDTLVLPLTRVGIGFGAAVSTYGEFGCAVEPELISRDVHRNCDTHV